MAMPWTRAKQIGRALRSNGDFPEGFKGSRTRAELTALFDACFRIQREASEAAGHHIPLVVENVRGAEPWVGPAQWHFGSFYLWGDVPALMPTTAPRKLGGGASWYPPSDPRHQPGLDFTRLAGQKVVAQNPDGRLLHRRDGHGHTRHLTNPAEHTGRKNGGDWFGSGADCSQQRRASSKSSARKAAAARIAKIPFELARHIAFTYHPSREKAA